MKIRYKIWLELGGRMLFGKGRAELLRALEEEGSLVKAAKRLNMSYRAAWGKLRASEEHPGVKLVEPSPAGRHGMALTPQGRLLLEEYERLLAEAEAFFGERVGRFAAVAGKGPGRQKETPRAGTRGATRKKKA
jgi:molybdate transport system regulatory protein